MLDDYKMLHDLMDEVGKSQLGENSDPRKI